MSNYSTMLAEIQDWFDCGALTATEYAAQCEALVVSSTAAYHAQFEKKA